MITAWVLSALCAEALIAVNFAHSYTGPAGANQNSGNITLDFTVDALGNVVLDASCVQAGPTVYIDEFDGAVGTATDPAIWGQSFSITLSRSPNNGTLRINNTGAGLAVQGQNPQLVDKADEVITAMVAVSGSTFDLRSVSYGNATTSAGTQLDANGISYSLSTASGTVDVSAQAISSDFTISSASDADSQGYVLTGLTFDLVSSATGPLGFDNDSGDQLWTTAANWNPAGLPAAPSDAVIDGYDVILNTAAAASPTALQLLEGSLTLSGAASLSPQSMELGRVLESTATLVMDGSSASFTSSGAASSDVFAVGSAGTVQTLPDSSGTSPLNLGAATLTLDLGSQWILDGSQFPGPYTLGDHFVLANYGAFSGSTSGVRTRNFALPANRTLRLVSTATTLYYKVVAQTPASGPNIIIVNVDDMVGGQHFNFEGRDCLTPTLDSLAANGIQFTEAFAASTVCGPSRYSLMTGRWASRNTSAHYLSKYPLNTVGRFGVSDTEFEEDGQNLGAWLQQAGYRTGFVGKGHLTDDDLVKTANWPSAGLLQYPQNANPAADPAVNAAMKHNHRVLCQMMRRHGFDFVDGYYRANLAELRNDSLNVHNQEWITKNALDFIDENHNQSFFLYMAPTINHGPVRNDLSKSLLADSRYTSAGYFPNMDYSFMPARQSIVDEVNNASKALISARETWIDYSMAAIVDKLTEHGVRNNTLIIFTADHGERTLPGTPVVWGKSSLYDLGMRVPLVMNWPSGISSAGRTYDELTSHIDFVPTLLELAGASNLPTGPVDGISLVPVLNGSSTSLRDDLFCEIGYARGVRTKDSKYIAVRYPASVYNQIDSGYLWKNHQTGNFTEPRPYYVNNSSLGSLAQGTHPGYFDDDQLYDLVADSSEQQNIYGTDPTKAYDLKRRLADYIGSIPARPFRHFNDASTEFSPAPVNVPTTPGAIQLQFLGVNQVKLDWTDASNNELGYIVEKSVNGAPFQIIDEKPSGDTTSTIAVDAGVEDILLQVSAYNALGKTGAANPVDLLAPNFWRFRTFGDIDPNLTTPFSQWSTDADNDGQSNLWEYVFGTNPRLTSSVAHSEGKITVEGANSYLEYKVPRDARRTIEIIGSVSENLSLWSDGEPACIVIEDEPTYLLLRAAEPVENKPKQFIRAQIEEP